MAQREPPNACPDVQIAGLARDMRVPLIAIHPDTRTEASTHKVPPRSAAFMVTEVGYCSHQLVGSKAESPKTRTSYAPGTVVPQFVIIDDASESPKLDDSN
jgi:hypothetical protein